MYKKIKNSSFMNLIWFMLCILPFVLLLIYSINFISNNKNYKTIYNEINQNTINEFAKVNMIYDTNTNTYINSDTPTNTTRAITLNIQFENEFFIYNQTITNGTKQNLLFIIFNDNTNIRITNLDDNYYFNISNIDLTHNNNTYTINDITTLRYGTLIQNETSQNTIIAIFKTNNNLNNIINNYSLTTNNKYININIENNYEQFLNEINNTIKTNGFISNAFLNLTTLFGVQNVYYSLACYYIEYLLIIILLHLAFDLLYIVPNICHKFMEKIGGERD